MAGDVIPTLKMLFLWLETHPNSYNAFIMAGDSSPLLLCFFFGWGLIPNLIMLLLWLVTHSNSYNAFLLG
jgi:hypothetical protein